MLTVRRRPLARPVFGGCCPGFSCSGVVAGTHAADPALGALAARLDRIVAARTKPGGARCRDDLEARRQSRCPASRRRRQDDRWRYLRGAGSSVARARYDDAGSAARHRCAGTEGVMCRGIAAGGSRRATRCAICSAKAASRSTISAPTNITAASSPMSRRSATANVSAALLARGHARSYNGGHRGSWCNSASAVSRITATEKAAQTARLFAIMRQSRCRSARSRPPVVPTETR